MRKNRSVRFGFGGLTVLVARSGYEVSFYTAVGGGLGEQPSTPVVLLFIRRFVFGSFCASACHCSGTGHSAPLPKRRTSIASHQCENCTLVR